MTTAATYDIGDRRQLACLITDQANAAADPTELTFKMREPDGVTTVYMFGVDDQVVRVDTGSYYVYWDCAQHGIHWWRYETDGSLKVAEETSFAVRRTRIPDIESQ